MHYSVRISGEFDSAHSLVNDPDHGRVHGHGYRVEVQADLRFEAQRRQVTDTKPLQEAVASLCRELDGRNLNEMLPGVVSTPDGVASYFMERLLLSFPLVKQVTIWERAHCAFTVSRELTDD